jgi:hypothetical protein
MPSRRGRRNTMHGYGGPCFVPRSWRSRVGTSCHEPGTVSIRDVLQKTLGSRASDSRLATYGKLATLLLGSAAVALAVTEAKVIFWFVLFAWSDLACAFAPPVLNRSEMFPAYDVTGPCESSSTKRAGEGLKCHMWSPASGGRSPCGLLQRLVRVAVPPGGSRPGLKRKITCTYLEFLW